MAPRTARSSNLRRKATVLGFVAFLAVTTAFVFSGGSQQGMVRTQNIGSDRLVSWNALPEMGNAMCPWIPASASMSLVAALQQSSGAGASEPARGGRLERDPLRVIRDPYPSYSVVTMDVERGEVVVGDENLFQILVYDRLADTPPGARFTEPKRVIAGPDTGIEFVCGSATRTGRDRKRLADFLAAGGKNDFFQDFFGSVGMA